MKVDISIIGGAGPQAGSLLFDQIIEICQKKFGCSRDYDFPCIELLSFPFTEMLHCKVQQIEKELESALNFVRGTQVVIACNTLHLYIAHPHLGLLHLMEEGAKAVKQPPLVLCSRVSMQEKLHQRFFSCIYPMEDDQNILDMVIDRILKNGPSEEIKSEIVPILKKYQNTPLLLGCTEFSLLHKFHSLGEQVLDLSQIAAEKLCSNYFSKKSF